MAQEANGVENSCDKYVIDEDSSSKPFAVPETVKTGE